jgi:endonuclease III
MIGIGIVGGKGRMGRAIAALLTEHDKARLAGAADQGDDVLRLAADCDVLIDFSTPAALAATLEAARAAQRPVVVGTTGLAADHHRAIDDAAAGLAVLQAANTSLGVNLLSFLVREAASRLGPDWDIEILEMHHRHKVDAPSGTALLLGEAAAQGRGVEFDAVRAQGRDGLTGPRAAGEIGFAVLRGGSVAGDHQVILAGEGERIELGHRAESRAIFATGGAVAARPAARALRHGRGAGPGMKKAEVEDFYARLAERTPNPETELESVNTYTLLVAVVLSAQATDAGVNLATRDLFRTVRTPGAMVALGEEGLKAHIRTIGLFNTKAKNVIALSQALIERHGGEVPADRDALEALPGVGRKTANVVMNTAFGAETFAVDTHVFRVANRTGLAPGKTPLAVETGLDRATPPPYRRDAHHLLILHGRYVCKARRPECWRCVVADLCRYRPKTPPPGSEAPGTASAMAARPRSKEPTG